MRVDTKVGSGKETIHKQISNQKGPADPFRRRVLGVRLILNCFAPARPPVFHLFIDPPIDRFDCSIDRSNASITFQPSTKSINPHIVNGRYPARRRGR